MVHSEADEKKSAVLCDLMQGAIVVTLDNHFQTRADGSVRALVVEPVWLGWLTLTTRAGVSNLERLQRQATEPTQASMSPPASPGAAGVLARVSPQSAGGAVRVVLSLSVCGPPARQEAGGDTATGGTTNGSDSAHGIGADGAVVPVLGAQRVAEDAPRPTSHGADSEIDRILGATNPFAVLALPLALTEDLAAVRKEYKRVSLSVHPDKNPHPEAAAAFRRVYGAFEALCDLGEQRRVLGELSLAEARAGMSAYMQEIQAAVDRAGVEADDDGSDDDEHTAKWWMEASEVELSGAVKSTLPSGGWKRVKLS